MGLAPSAISTARLDLIPLVPGDAAEMVTVLADQSMYQFTGGQPPTLAELLARYGRLAVGRSPSGGERWFNWIVRLREDAVAVGVLQATVAAGDTAAEVAWEVGVPWQRRGYAAEAAAAVVAWLVDRGVEDISASIHPAHDASMRVAATAGLQPTAEVVEGEVVWRRPRQG